MALYGGARSLRALWPVLLVAGGSFALFQFTSSNFINYALTDVLASLGSLIITLLFLRVWHPAPDAEFVIEGHVLDAERTSTISPWHGWVPWAIVSIVVIVWTLLNIANIAQRAIHWPG